MICCTHMQYWHVISGADQAVPRPGPKATLVDRRLRIPLVSPRGSRSRSNSSAVLSRSARSVFVGGVAAAGSCGDGAESCSPRQRGVRRGLQCGPHAQVSVCDYFQTQFFIRETAGPRFSFFFVVKVERKAACERGRSTVCTVYPGGFTLLLSLGLRNPLFSLHRQPESFWFVLACCAARASPRARFSLRLALPLSALALERRLPFRCAGSADGTRFPSAPLGIVDVWGFVHIVFLAEN